MEYNTQRGAADSIRQCLKNMLTVSSLADRIGMDADRLQGFLDKKIAADQLSCKELAALVDAVIPEEEISQEKIELICSLLYVTHVPDEVVQDPDLASTTSAHINTNSSSIPSMDEIRDSEWLKWKTARLGNWSSFCIWWYGATYYKKMLCAGTLPSEPDLTIHNTSTTVTMGTEVTEPNGI